MDIMQSDVLTILRQKLFSELDEQGMLVIDEAFDHWQKEKNPQDYHRFFDEWNEKDISAMVLRDRNHPSVIMWSIGNEIQERSDDAGVEIAERLRNIVKKLYPATSRCCMAFTASSFHFSCGLSQ